MTKISRRAFLRGAIALGGGAFLTVNGNHYQITFGKSEQVVYKLRVLHTNDHHARIEPVSGVTITAPNVSPSVTRNFGGVTRRKTLIDDIRASKAADEEILLLDAGDVFQGTLYFNVFAGAADLFFYNGMQYDAMAVGNHEFDRGQAALRDFVAGATFPVLSANVQIAAGAVLEAVKSPTALTPAGKLGTRTIITKGAKKIGIFGLTPPDTATLSSPGTGVTINPASLASIAQAEVDALKAEGADYIVGLTHIGYDADKALAAAVKGINVIIGGHSHTPLLPATNPPTAVGIFPGSTGSTASGGPYPTIIKDPDNKDVVVCTDWEWGKWLGDMTVGFDASGTVSVISGVIRPVWADGISGTPPRALIPGEQAPIAENQAFKDKIATDYKPQITTLEQTKVGETATKLDGDRPNVRTRETNLGNLIADTMLNRTLTDGAQVALTNGGGIRASINPGNVTVGNVLTVLPFGNTIALVTLTGAQLLEALEHSVSRWSTSNPSGAFAQVAGLKFVFAPQRRARVFNSDPALAVAGQRIVSAEVKSSSGQFVSIDPAANYRVATNNFMLSGGDAYDMLPKGTNKIDTGFLMADVLSEFFQSSAGPVDIKTDGRITANFKYQLPMIAKQQA
jgi:5'-nucleotidase